MPAQPRYPGTSEDTSDQAGSQPLTSRQRHGRLLLIVVLVVLVVAMIVLHAAGVLGKGTM
ncbi:MAG TPA: hypothetical protein VF070_25340 [Streptosporangiaceae bacterium]